MRVSYRRAYRLYLSYIVAIKDRDFIEVCGELQDEIRLLEIPASKKDPYNIVTNCCVTMEVNGPTININRKKFTHFKQQYHILDFIQGIANPEGYYILEKLLLRYHG